MQCWKVARLDYMVEPPSAHITFSSSSSDSLKYLSEIFWTVCDEFQDPQGTGIFCLSSLCGLCDPLTPPGTSGMMCCRDSPFEHPAQHWQSGCQEDICCQSLLKQVKPLHKLPVSLDRAVSSGWSGSQIFCIP